MKLIKQISIQHGGVARHIDLLVGDLTQIPPEHAVDVLVVSAFPDDYTPTPGSLIGSLAARGLSVKSLSLDKQDDLRQNFSCWLSKPLSPAIPGLAFSRILCFEPAASGKPPELLGQIFQALAPFTFAAPRITSVALPVVAAGDQGYSISTMLMPLLDASINWLQAGLPIATIKLVLQNEKDLAEAMPLFDTHGSGGSPPLSESRIPIALSEAKPRANLVSSQ